MAYIVSHKVVCPGQQQNLGDGRLSVSGSHDQSRGTLLHIPNAKSAATVSSTKTKLLHNEKAANMIDDIDFGASHLDQRLHYRHMPVLSSYVERGPPVLHIVDEG